MPYTITVPKSSSCHSTIEIQSIINYDITHATPPCVCPKQISGIKTLSYKFTEQVCIFKCPTCTHSHGGEMQCSRTLGTEEVASLVRFPDKRDCNVYTQTGCLGAKRVLCISDWWRVKSQKVVLWKLFCHLTHMYIRTTPIWLIITNSVFRAAG